MELMQGHNCQRN